MSLLLVLVEARGGQAPALRPRIGTLAGLREDSRYPREYGGAESIAREGSGSGEPELQMQSWSRKRSAREGQALALRGRPGGYSRAPGVAGGIARLQSAPTGELYLCEPGVAAGVRFARSGYQFNTKPPC